MDAKIPPWLKKAENTEFSSDVFPRYHSIIDQESQNRLDEDVEKKPQRLDSDQNHRDEFYFLNQDPGFSYKIKNEDNNQL